MCLHGTSTLIEPNINTSLCDTLQYRSRLTLYTQKCVKGTRYCASGTNTTSCAICFQYKCLYSSIEFPLNNNTISLHLGQE